MKRIIPIIIVIITMLGCSNDHTENAPISFKVNSDLLAEEFTFSEIGICFNPPKNWEAVNKAVLSDLQSKTMALQDTTGLVVKPVNIFMENSLSVCVVSQFSSPLLVKDMQQNYIYNLQLENKDVKINEGSFAHNGIDFQQLTFNKSGNVNLKLLGKINNQVLFLVDYILPLKDYEKSLRTIESSIGSIRKEK